MSDGFNFRSPGGSHHSTIHVYTQAMSTLNQTIFCECSIIYSNMNPAILGHRKIIPRGFHLGHDGRSAQSVPRVAWSCTATPAGTSGQR